jgi:RNA polymerase sigma factor (sigma-70 family)
MASGSGVDNAEWPIRRIFGDGTVSGMDEGELLRRFASRRDPVALEALVVRHGPMVLGVCRRVLGNRHASEDAFQATFLVLAKKAGTIRDPDRLGPWLHGVAHRVAVRSRADLARRNAHEKSGAEEAAMAASSSEPDFDRAEMRATLDEEVGRLPEKFRDPIVLCYLDGLTHDEAAVRLRCPVGTVRSRLSTGRARLRDRLVRRGVVVPSGVFASALIAEAASAAVSPALLVSTVRASTAFAAGLTGATAAGVVSASVASLAEGVTTTMIVSKLKIIGALALSGMLTLGVGAAAAQRFGGSGESAQNPKAADDKIDDLIAQLKQQVKQSELRAKELEARYAALRQEVENTQRQAQLQEVAAKKIETTVTKTGTAVPGAMAGGVPGSVGAGSAAGGTGGGGFGGGGGGIGGAGSFGGGGGGGLGGMGAGMGRGNMAGGMPGGIGGGNARALAALQMEDYVIFHKPKSDKVAGYSTETGEWASYDVPPGSTVVPIASQGVAALNVVGDAIGQLATFAPKTGKWYPIDLKEPVKGHATPVVSQQLAVYPVGRYVYAFSSPALAWDVLELKEGAKPAPVVWTNRATVESGDHLYIFSVKTGKWTDFDATSSPAAVREAK